MKRLALIGLAAIATGCSWSHPYKNEQEFYADKMECSNYARQSAPSPSPIAAENYANMSPQMQGSAGAYQGGAQLGAGIAQSINFRDCMKAKGYQ